jgi:hypothetical protein
MVPHVVAAAALGAVAGPAAVAGWGAALLTGRLPRPVAGLLAGTQRSYARVNGSLYLVTDVLPRWRGQRAHPVELVVGPSPPHLGRRAVARRAASLPWLLAINAGLGVVVVSTAGAAWPVVLATGRMPLRMHRAIVLGTSYHARCGAYLSLLTDVRPHVRERDPVTGARGGSGRGGI